MPKIQQPCTLCRARGRLWLGGRNYLECPDCGGTGTFIMYEQRVVPKRFFWMPGVQPPAEIVVPHRMVE